MKREQSIWKVCRKIIHKRRWIRKRQRHKETKAETLLETKCDTKRQRPYSEANSKTFIQDSKILSPS